jgi:hypothetical protein
MVAMANDPEQDVDQDSSANGLVRQAERRPELFARRSMCFADEWLAL